MKLIYIGVIILLFLIINDCICNRSNMIEGSEVEVAEVKVAEGTPQYNPQQCINNQNNESCLQSGNCHDKPDCAAKRLCLQRNIICGGDTLTGSMDRTHPTKNNACEMIQDYRNSVTSDDNPCHKYPGHNTYDCFSGDGRAGFTDYKGQPVTSVNYNSHQLEEIFNNFCSKNVSDYLGCSNINENELAKLSDNPRYSGKISSAFSDRPQDYDNLFINNSNIDIQMQNPWEESDPAVNFPGDCNDSDSDSDSDL